jgi:hypothetical protein
MSEAGHAKNVANFETLTNIIIALGALYNPVNTAILLIALQSMLADAKAAIIEVGGKDSQETNAGKLRETAFEGHAKLATRVGNAYAAGNTEELVSENIAAIVRKLRGSRKGDKPESAPNIEGGEPVDKSHSVSQQSYDSIVANWRLLIQLLETQIGYKPNEEDLTLETLAAFVNDLEAKNNAAKIATINVQNARAQRDEILYNEETGMLAIVRKVKKYVSTISPTAYAQLVDLKFKRVK